MKSRHPRSFTLSMALLGLSLLFGVFQERTLAKDQMNKYASPEVRLYTDIGKDRAGKVMDDIAFFAKFIDDFFQSYGISRKKKNPIRCRLFGDYHEFKEFGRKANVLSQAGAYFSTNNNCIVAPYQEGSKSALSTLRHECAHQILYRYFNELPPWIDEGFACYFGGMEFDAHRNLISACSSNARLKEMRNLLHSGSLVDWDHLFGIELRSVFNDEIRRGVLNMGKFYTQSWGVVYFYLHTEDESARSLFTRVIKGMNTGRKRPQETAKDFTRQVEVFTEFMREGHEKVSAHYNAACKLKAARSYKEALEQLLALLERNPSNTAALRLAGETAWEGGLYEHALSFWKLLSEQDPRNPDYPWRVCRCMVETSRVQDNPDLIPESVETGLAAVKLTKSLDPDSLAALAMAYHAAGELRKALSTMRKATRYSCADHDHYKKLEKQYSAEIIEGIKKGR